MTKTADIARELILHQPPTILRSVQSRKKFSRDLCDALQFWSCEEVSFFVDEMRGLNFSSPSDRETFLSLLFMWLNVEGVR